MSNPDADDPPIHVHDALVAYDESSAILPVGAASHEDQSRLTRDLECLDLLRRVWPEPSLEQEETEPPPRELGDFRIIREIGRGGMGVVYEAEQLSLGRRIALKVLPYAAMLEEKAITRFKNEARAAATLDHPNIVPIHAVGSDRGMHFYAMGLIDGVTLTEVIAGQSESRESPARPTQSVLTGNHETVANAALSTLAEHNGEDRFRVAARLGVEAARALHHAHERGVVHRDIKPSNLLLDGLGKLWVADFGLARVESEASLTLSGGLVGTLRYMAPEQVITDSVGFDHRVDVYALGLTLYELITGKPAFNAPSRAALIRQIEGQDPSPLRRVVPSAPRDLETILSKAVEKLPSDRYSTAEQLARDLQRFLDDQHIEARPPSSWSRVVKWSRRHVAALLFTLVAVSVLSVVAVAATTLVLDANREKDAALLSAESSLSEVEEQRALAETKAAEAEAVTAFVSTILSAPTPRKRQGENLTLETVLDRAAADLEAKFPNQPLVEATVRSMLGQSFEGIGKPRRAREQFEACLELRRKHLGPDADKTRWAEDGLQRVALMEDKHAALLPQLQQQAEDGLANLREDPKATLEKLKRYALALRRLGRRKEALALFEKALDISNEHVGPDSEWSLNMLVDRAATLEPGELATVDAGREAFERYRDAKGADHINTLVAQNNYGTSLMTIGRIPEAIVVFEEVAKRNEQVFGPDHINTLLTLGNLAHCYIEERRLDEADDITQRTLPVLLETLGESHSLTITALAARAELAFLRNDYRVAVERHAKLRSLMTQSNSDERIQLEGDSQYAQALVMVGQVTEGLQLSRQAVERAEKRFGYQDRSYLGNACRHATCLLNAGRRDDAEPLVRDALQNSEGCPPSALKSRANLLEVLKFIEDTAGEPK